jgi:uncharacterized protein YndB with AHSA1/START domain
MSQNYDVQPEASLHSIGGVGVLRMRGSFKTNVNDLWSAITDPLRLAHWYGRVAGNLHEDGEFTATVFASGWDGQGHIDECDPSRKLEVTMWERDDAKHVVMAELIGEGALATLALEVRGVALDVLYAYGAGWQVHVEDLGALLAGREYVHRPARWDELEPTYREMAIVPLDGL